MQDNPPRQEKTRGPNPLKNPRRGLAIALGVLTSAAAFFVSTGLGEQWPLTWLAPVPVLILAFNSSIWTAAASAGAAYLLGSFNLLPYLSVLVPTGVLLGILLVPALMFALAVLVARYAVLRLEPWASLFALPAAWTSYEWLLSRLSPDGTAMSLAYTQTDLLPLLQIASLTGLWGITFVLLLIPAGLAVAWHFRAQRPRALRALAVALAIGLLTLGYGWMRLTPSVSQPSLHVGLAASDETVRYFQTENPPEALAVAQAYARRIRDLAARGAQVIVLPEKFVGVTSGDRGDILRVLSEAARTGGAMVVAGLNQVGPDRRRNTAVVWSPDGTVLAEYDKSYLVPGFESRYQPGTKPGIFSAGGRVWGVAICKDMDFPDWTRAYARAGAGIILVPAWDFIRDGRLHARMAVVRGVESGLAVVRAAQEGRLTVSDPQGRILAEASSSSAPEVLLVSEVAPGPGRTLFSRAGNWFGWSSLLVLMVIVTSSGVRARKPLGG